MANKLVVKDDGGEISRRAMVLSIVGFGGLGKTTLAKEVCRRLEEEFPYQAMVSVSQAFEAGRDLEELCKRVLEQMEMVKAENARGTKDDGETPLLAADTRLSDNNKDPALKLMEFLKDKRIETVAKACSPAIAGQHFIHQMQRLKPEDSKKLFHVRTFGNKECPKELASTTDKILRRCAGLPLAIVSIANVLAGYTSAENKYKWESIYNSMGSQMESNPTLEGMKQIITLSYNHLSHELKSCMLYLSIFPEDYEIDKHRLLCRWIAEGLVMERRGLTLMEVAESYLDELVSRNMIELLPGE
nr:unnamed protein product [Digitaria exilis]